MTGTDAELQPLLVAKLSCGPLEPAASADSSL